MSALEVVGVVIAFWLGWVYAHYTIAQECERVGKWFIGKRVFVCRRESAEVATNQRGGD